MYVCVYVKVDWEYQRHCHLSVAAAEWDLLAASVLGVGEVVS